MVTTPGLLVNSTTEGITDVTDVKVNEDNAFGFIILGVFLGIIAILVVGCVLVYTDILSCIVRIFKKKKRQPKRPPRSAYFIEDPYGSPKISRSHIKLHESRP